MEAETTKNILLDQFLDLSKVDRQIFLNQLNTLQARTGFILASSGLISVITQTFVDKGILHLNWYLTSGIVLSVLTIILSLFVLWSEKYQLNPDIRNFLKDWSPKGVSIAKEKLLNYIYYGNTHNNKILNRKSRFLNGSLVTFYLSIILILIGIFIAH